MIRTLDRLLALLITFTALSASAQPPLATLTGEVVDIRTGQPVKGASLYLVPGNISLTATADSAGKFRMAAVPVGHYALRAAAVGYDTLEVPELLLRAGKQSEQRLELSPTGKELSSVTINPKAREQVSPLGAQAFTVEQSLRWPSTFSDPGRLVAAFPGVVQVGNGANHLSIRGNGPNTNAWYLQGAEIVSPNHLGNAGTASDLPTSSGGGVNILSAQMLGTSQLLTGVMPPGKDNALGGILDMQLRNGNSSHQEWTLQADLVGLDVSTEGPIGKGGRSSYLVNYRYSTVGLLNAIGVDLGDEAVNFQDLSFHVTLPAGKRGELHLFGLGGNSSNNFDAKRDTTKWKTDKDSKDINFTASAGAAGASVRLPLKGSAIFSSTFVVSESDQDRREDGLNKDFSIQYSTDIPFSERKISAVAQVEGAVGSRFGYAAGASATQRSMTTLIDSDLNGWLMRPWLIGRYSLTERLQATAGFGVSYFTFNEDLVAEPRAGLEWKLRNGGKWALEYGVRALLPEWQVMNVQPVGQVGFSNHDIGMIRSHDLVLGMDLPIKKNMTLHGEVYYQQLVRAPLPYYANDTASLRGLSILNVWDLPIGSPLQNTGDAYNTGVELSVNHRFADHYYYAANATVYTSRYTDAHGDEYDSRWAGTWGMNLLGGKEFAKVKEAVTRTWGLSGRLNAGGGPRANPEALGAVQNPPVFDTGLWTVQLGATYSLDVRVYLKHDHQRRTGTWALDLQNVTNAQNPAYSYYDNRKGEMVTKYQLGIIPNLSYRLEF